MNTKASNYEITTVEGTLTVDPLLVAVHLECDSITYDGYPNAPYNVLVSVNGGYLAGADSMNVTTGPTGHPQSITDDINLPGGGKLHISCNGETNAGIYSSFTPEYSFTEGNAGNYALSFSSDPMIISPRNVTLTSATDSKTYDGTPLTNGTVTVGDGGFAANDGATYNVTGSQTDAGSSANTFTYTLNSNTKPGNYTISTAEGTLTVSKQPINFTLSGSTLRAACPDCSGYSVENSAPHCCKVTFNWGEYLIMDLTSTDAFRDGIDASALDFGCYDLKGSRDILTYLRTNSISSGGILGD